MSGFFLIPVRGLALALAIAAALAAPARAEMPRAVGRALHYNGIPLNRVAIMPRGKHGQTLGQGDRVRFSRHAMRGAGIEEIENVYCLEQTWRA